MDTQQFRRALASHEGMSLVEALIGLAGCGLLLFAFLHFVSLTGKSSTQSNLDSRLGARFAALQMALAEPGICTNYFKGINVGAGGDIPVTTALTFPGRTEPLFAAGVTTEGWTTASLILSGMASTGIGTNHYSGHLQVRLVSETPEEIQGPSERLRQFPVVLQANASGVVQSCYTLSTDDLLALTCTALGGTMTTEVPPKCVFARCASGQVMTGMDANSKPICKSLDGMIQTQIAAMGVCPAGQVVTGFDATGAKICAPKTVATLPGQPPPQNATDCSNLDLGPNSNPGYTQDGHTYSVTCMTRCADTNKASKADYMCQRGTWSVIWGETNGLLVKCPVCGKACAAGTVSGQLGSWCVQGAISVPSGVDGTWYQSTAVCSCREGCGVKAEMGMMCVDGRWTPKFQPL